MDKYKNLKIIAFVGLAGSGKTSAVEYLTKKGFPKVYFGGIILEAMRKEGIEWTPENEQKFRENMRNQYGIDFVGKEIIKEINNLYNAGQHKIVADGLYSWSEYKLLKSTFHQHLKLVALFSPRHMRHHRLVNRPIRPMSEEQASKRDYDEIENLEKGGPIAIADYTILNNHDYNDFYKQIDTILDEIDF